MRLSVAVVAPRFLGFVSTAWGSTESSGEPVTAIVVGLDADPPPGISRWTTAQEAGLRSTGSREVTVTGNGLHESGGPETPQLASRRAGWTVRA